MKGGTQKRGWMRKMFDGIKSHLPFRPQTVAQEMAEPPRKHRLSGMNPFCHMEVKTLRAGFPSERKRKGGKPKHKRGKNGR